MKKKSIALLLVAVLCVSLFSACATSEPAKTEAAPTEAAKTEAAPTEEAKTEAPPVAVDTVTVGLVFPVSGGSASPGQMNIWGIEDYFNYINEKGGIQSLGGAKLETVVKDTEGAADVAVTATENLIGDDSISVLMGTYNSGTMSAVQPVAAKYNMPMVGVNSVGSYCYTTPNECIVHAVNVDQQDIDYMIAFYKWMHDEQGVKSAFLVLDNSELSTNNQKLLDTTLTGAGMPIEDMQVFNVGASDFTTIVQKIKAAEPGMIIAQMGVNDAILFTQTLNEYSITIPVQGMGAGFSDPTYLEAVGELGKGLICSSYWFPAAASGDFAKGFVDNCLKEHGMQANEPWAIGWTAAAVLVDALERAGSTDRAAIAKALVETKLPADSEANELFHYPNGIRFETFECANGDTVYNQNPEVSVMYSQYDGETYQVIYPLEAATAELNLGK